jgi:drug/metabolite transporter (DMT)-like permease
MTPLALFVATVAIWGTTWIAIKFQVDAVAPEVGVALRFSIAAAVVLALCLARGIRLALPARVHALLAGIGLLGFCVSYLFVYHAERFIVSGLVAVGYAAAPLINMLLARALLRTPMSRRVAAGGLLGLAGIALVFWPEFARLQGDRPLVIGALLTAGAVLASCLSNIGMARAQGLGIKGWAPLGIAMAWGAACAWLAVAVAGRSTGVSWSWPFGLSLAYLSLAGSVLAFAAYYSLLGKVGPARAAYVGVMSTIVALLISALFEGYDWRLATFVGIALAVGGNVLALQDGSSLKRMAAEGRTLPGGPTGSRAA